MLLVSHLSTCLEANTPLSPVMPGSGEVTQRLEGGEACINTSSDQPMLQCEPTSSSKVALNSRSSRPDPQSHVTRFGASTV